VGAGSGGPLLTAAPGAGESVDEFLAAHPRPAGNIMLGGLLVLLVML
jgi:hypothetical protein